MADYDVSQRVLDVLEAAEEPLSTGQIQRRVAADGLDVATSAIRQACRDLEAEGKIESVGEAARKYRSTG